MNEIWVPRVIHRRPSLLQAVCGAMTKDHQIEHRAAAALAADGTAGIDELDLILTDGAAEALALHTELLRVNRRLAAVLDNGDQDLETLDGARSSRAAGASSPRLGVRQRAAERAAGSTRPAYHYVIRCRSRPGNSPGWVKT